MLDWQRIGLAAPSFDPVEIKRAYARTLKTTRPDDDAEAYQALREAYDRLNEQARLARARAAAELVEAAEAAPAPSVVEEITEPARSPVSLPVEDVALAGVDTVDPSALVAPLEAWERDAARAETPEPVVVSAGPAQAASPPDLEPADDLDLDFDTDPPRSWRPPATRLPPPRLSASEPPPAPAPAVPAVPVVPAWAQETDTVPAVRGAAEIVLWLESLCVQGRSALALAVPELRLALEQLPIGERPEASVRLAHLVLRFRERIPATVLGALQEEFGWLEDYRSERMLGPDMAEALRPLLEGAERPITDPMILHRHAELLGMNRLFAADRDGRAFWAGVWMGEFWRRRMAEFQFGQVRRMGVSEGAFMRLREWVGPTGWTQLGLVVVVLMLLGFALTGGAADGAALGLVASLQVAMWWIGGMGVLIAVRAWRQAQLIPPRWDEWLAERRIGRLMRGWPVWRPAVGVGCLLAAAALMADAPLSDGGVFVAAALVFCGVGLALPARLEPAIVAMGLWLLCSAGLPKTGGVGPTLLLAWTLGGVHLHLKRLWRVEDGRSPDEPVGPPRGWRDRLLLPTIGLPVLLAWVADRAGWRLVMGALLLAAGPGLGAYPPPAWATVPGLWAAVLLMLGLQRLGLRLGRRMVGAERLDR